MPDPLTAFGAAAASAQFVDLAAKVLLKTIRFAKDLREVPKKLADLLQEVECSTTRVLEIFTIVLQPGSKVFKQLDAVQVDRLAQVVTELHQAMDDLNRTLTPLELERLRAGKTLRRFWKSVMAVNAEKDVSNKLQKVDRLNNEVDRQLGVTGLELQAAIADKFDQAGIAARDDKADLTDAVSRSSHNLQMTIQAKHAATTNDLTGIASTTRGIHHTVTNTESRAQDIHRTVTDIASVTRGTHQTVADIASTTQSVHRTVTEFRSSVTAIDMGMSHLAEDTATIRQGLAILTDPEMPKPVSHQQMECLMSRLVSQHDLLELRDELVAMSTGQIHRMSATSQTTSQTISKADQEAVQESARRELMRCPSSLAEAAASLRPGGHLRAQRCRCRPFREFTDASFWALSLRAEKSNEHLPACRYAKSGARSWAYSARAALTPFLNLTLELAIGATARGTTWSLASPLRFYRTVRRSTSPLFQAFDQLPSQCVDFYVIQRGTDNYVIKDEHGKTRDTVRFYEAPPHSYGTFVSDPCIGHILPYYSRRQRDSVVYVHWDIDAVKCRLQALGRQIARLVQQGVSVGDVDEQGRTIMFSFVWLILLFQRQVDVLSAQFRTLFDIIMDSNVDQTVQTTLDNEVYAALYRFQRPITAWEYFFWRFHYLGRDISGLPGSSVSYIFDHVAGYISPAGNPDETIYANYYLWAARTLDQYPDIAEGLGLTDLQVAVLRRSLDDVGHLIAKEDRSKHPDERLATALARNWPDGLRCLVAANYPVAEALKLLFSNLARSGVVQISIILDSPQPLFSSNFGFNLLWVARYNDSITEMILAELLKRRTALRDLAVQSLSPDEQKGIGISTEEMLDVNAQAAFYCLKQVTDVPDALDCWMSPYHIVPPFMTSCRHLDKFYNAGFKAVDIPDDEGYTPLLGWLRENIGYPTPADFEVLYWLLSRGARPEWTSMRDPEGVRYPTILFYLALVCRDGMLHRRHVSTHLKAFERCSDIVSTALHMVRDGCACFCSTGGCLPIHLLWRCNSRRCDCDCGGSGSYHRRDWIFSWFNAWRLSGQKRELLCSEVVRLELFERLGLAHTCCCNSADNRDQLYPRLCLDEDERTRMQEEDEELSLQLEALMSHYNTAAKQHHGTYESFWELWWQVVDEILPPLLPMEACKNRLLDPSTRDTHKFRDRDRTTMENRAAREAEALHRAGYVGSEFQDFRDVIRAHFSGRGWNPEGWEPRRRDFPQGDGADDSEGDTWSSDTDSLYSGSGGED